MDQWGAEIPRFTKSGSVYVHKVTTVTKDWESDMETLCDLIEIRGQQVIVLIVHSVSSSQNEFRTEGLKFLQVLSRMYTRYRSELEASMTQGTPRFKYNVPTCTIFSFDFTSMWVDEVHEARTGKGLWCAIGVLPQKSLIKDLLNLLLLVRPPTLNWTAQADLVNLAGDFRRMKNMATVKETSHDDAVKWARGITTDSQASKEELHAGQKKLVEVLIATLQRHLLTRAIRRTNKSKVNSALPASTFITLSVDVTDGEAQESYKQMDVEVKLTFFDRATHGVFFNEARAKLAFPNARKIKSADYGPESSASPEPEAYQNRKLSLTAFVQLLDEKRDQLMGELPPNVALDQLDAAALREYINLVLSAVDGFERVELAPDRSENADVLSDGRVLHDVDSALILSATFPWREQYDILTNYEEKRALHGNLHAQVRFEDEDTSQAEYRDPGSDSNVFWATCGDGGRHRIHIMLPKAGDTEMIEIHEAIYNATREACVYWNEASANSWSPTYETELNRTARFTNSRFRIESKKVVGEAFGSLVAEQVIESIRRKGWGKDAYWFIQMRGCKDFTCHDGSRTREVIDHLLEPVERTSSAIFVDVAVELQLQNGWACMPWRPDYAPETLAEVALGFEEGDWSWKKYQPDIWAGVAAIAGFRCNFANEPRTENLISYMQVYTTDKFQTYNPSGTSHKSLYLTGPQALHMKGPDEIPVPIHKVHNATVANQIENTPTATRIEARVPVQHASRVFSPTLQVQDLSDVLHVVPSYVIWAWRLHRLGACQLLLRLAASVRQDSRADTQYLTLVAALIYLLNSIHSRPGELHFDRKLAAAIFPTCSLEVNEWTVFELGFHNPRSRSTLVPFMEYGGIFLPSIVYPSELEGDVLRFQFLSRGLDRESAANALGMKLADIDALFVPEYLVDAFATQAKENQTFRSID
ncbi:hypothetical protein PM082_012665 [Marasmius tenuissimus]|nr:hypothetical protein PM082_012665 [Marasmius tenuissimus]